MPRHFWVALAAYTFCVPQAWTQPSGQAPNPADQQWEKIQALMARPGPDGQNQLLSREAVARVRRQLADRLLQAADEARAFGESYANHPKSREARLIEAKAIFQAAMMGDTSRMTRGLALLDEVRGDQALPAQSRVKLVALSETLRIWPLRDKRVEFLAAQEESAHRLITEFPAERASYSALLNCAETHPEDAEAMRIAQNFETLPAPADIKADARTLLERQALVGQSLPEIARVALGEDNPISSARGRGIILYSWATTIPSSVDAARGLTRYGPLSGPTDALMVGVNLDHDVSAARTTVHRAGLLGEQIYDPRGSKSPLALALKLTRPGEVYVASAQGILHSVSATRGNLTAKFSAAGRRRTRDSTPPISPTNPGNPAGPAGKPEK